MADESKKEKSGEEDLDAELDRCAQSFAPRSAVTDDELDELMTHADQAAAQKAASEFQHMLQQMVSVSEEALKKNDEGEPLPDDENTRQMVEAMKQLLNCTGQVANASNEQEFMEGLNMLRSPESEMEPFMGMIMESLVSKEVMYPPLKEVRDQYPKYLEENKAQLDEATLERYTKQFDVVTRICTEFEKVPDAPEANAEGTEGAPVANFEVLAKMLMELQTYGYPPKELCGDLPDGWAVDDATGMPKVENAEQAVNACSIM